MGWSGRKLGVGLLLCYLYLFVNKGFLDYVCDDFVMKSLRWD